MAETASRILLFALVAGVSPVAFLSALAVLTSARGRVNGVLFLAGFLLGQTAAFVTAFVIGSAATPEEAHEEARAGLELALGLALLALAWAQWRHRTEKRENGRPSRTKALLARLRNLRPGTAFSFGALLGIGGVKRLTVTLVAGATVGVSGLLPIEELTLGLVYILVAGALVWLPVGAYLVAGERAEQWMAGADSWITAHGRVVTLAMTLVFGALFIADALVRLL